MLLLTIFVAIVVVVLTLLLNWFLSLLKYAGLKTVPGPKPLPFIGNANEIGTTTVDFLQSLTKLQNEYGTIYKIWLGPRLHLILSKPEYLEQLLTSNVHLTKTAAYDMLRPWIGDGLLTSRGRKWKTRRKMITPTFHFKILEDFMTVFNKQFDIMVDILKDEAKNNEGQSTELQETITLASLDIICETAFGTPIRAQSKANPEFVKSVSGFLEIFMTRFFSAWLKYPILFRLSSYYGKHMEYLKILLDLSTKVIKERRAEWKTKQENSQSVNDFGIKKKAALLDMLLDTTFNDGEHLSNEDIREEVNTFMFELKKPLFSFFEDIKLLERLEPFFNILDSRGKEEFHFVFRIFNLGVVFGLDQENGHDTTSSGMSFTLYALSRNEEIQQKVYNEIVDVIGSDSKAEITISQINDLNYLDMVVKESLRIYPPVPFVERTVDSDWTIDGITIPKDTSITIFIYGMNQRPEVFPEPDKFDPERFLPEKQSSRHYYSYIPFSAGPRNCIGQKFATLELKTCIIKCLLNFKLIPDLDFEPEIGVCSVLRSRNGIKMKLSPRNKN